jgi:hypothetical protein
MAKKPSKPKAPEAVSSGAGQYRATCAFALSLERIERGSIVTLTAEQATALGSKVVPVAPQKAQEDKEQEASDSSDSSTANAGDGEAANQDQIV